MTERALLDARSDAAASAMIASLDDGQRGRLLEAMRTVRQLLTVAMLRIEPADAASPEAQRCLRAYVGELRRRAPDRHFDPSTGSTAEPDEVRPPQGAFLVARLDVEALALYESAGYSARSLPPPA
jgi:hypothetical protein